MKTIRLTLLLLFIGASTFSQGNKVYHEGEENEITSEINELEDLKSELKAAQREFLTAKELRNEYYDLTFKAYETGNIEDANKAIQSLLEAKKMAELSYERWIAYHKLNDRWQSPSVEADYRELIRRINEQLQEGNIESLKTGCCGPDIVELYLKAGNIVKLESVVSNKQESSIDFWVTGLDPADSSSKLTIGGKSIDLRKFEFKWLAVYGGETFKSRSQKINMRDFYSLDLVFVPKDALVDDVYCKLNMCFEKNDNDCKRCCIEDKSFVHSVDSYINFLNDGFSSCSFKYFISSTYPGRRGASSFVKSSDLKSYLMNYRDNLSYIRGSGLRTTDFFIETYNVEKNKVLKEHELILNKLKKGKFVDDSDLWLRFNLESMDENRNTLIGTIENKNDTFYNELAWLIQKNLYKQLF